MKIWNLGPIIFKSFKNILGHFIIIGFCFWIGPIHDWHLAILSNSYLFFFFFFSPFFLPIYSIRIQTNQSLPFSLSLSTPSLSSLLRFKLPPTLPCGSYSFLSFLFFLLLLFLFPPFLPHDQLRDSHLQPHLGDTHWPGSLLLPSKWPPPSLKLHALWSLRSQSVIIWPPFRGYWVSEFSNLWEKSSGTKFS